MPDAPHGFGRPGGNGEIDVCAEHRFRRVDLDGCSAALLCPEDGLDDVGEEAGGADREDDIEILGEGGLQSGDPGFRQRFAKKNDSWSDRRETFRSERWIS